MLKPPDTGIVIVEGIPGSGKTYKGVKIILEHLLSGSRRPIYTSLPIKLRVLRAYLKMHRPGSERYLFKLEQKHYRAYLPRACRLTELVEEVQREIGEGRRAFREAERRLSQEMGPDVLSGPEANYFPVGSMFLLDEIHRWFDQRDQSKESREILSYASMHRHFIHLIYLFTQDRMQVSKSWRMQCGVYIKCVDKRKLPFLWNIRFPLPCFFFESWAAETEGMPHARSMESQICFPFLDGGLIWRLYRSFTHAGSPREMAAQMKRAEDEILGVNGAPSVVVVPQMVPKRRRRLSKIWLSLAGIGLLAVFGVGVGKGCKSSVDSVQDVVARVTVHAPGAPASNSSLNSQMPTSRPAALLALRVGGVAGEKVLINSQLYGVGDDCNGVKVGSVDVLRGGVDLGGKWLRVGDVLEVVQPGSREDAGTIRSGRGVGGRPVGSGKVDISRFSRPAR